MIPTWNEIDDPSFILPNAIKIRRSPIKMLMHCLIIQSFLLIPLLMFTIGIIYAIIGHPKGFDYLVLGFAICVMMFPVWILPVMLFYRYLKCRGPAFVIRHDGLYINVIGDGHLVPWNHVEIVNHYGENEFFFMPIIIHVDPNEVPGTPPFGRLGMRRGLVDGLKKRRLGVPLIYNIGSSKFKRLMRAYKAAAHSPHK